VRHVEEMFEHPQVRAEDMVSSIAHPVIGSYRGVTRAIKFSRTPGPQPFSAPMLDQHGREIAAANGTHNGKPLPGIEMEEPS
jgi:crotonobetainyl-CoA:carnitine CoA-transferase CaiB-like acyl-CoA transferase